MLPHGWAISTTQLLVAANMMGSGQGSAMQNFKNYNAYVMSGKLEDKTR